ncbi:CDP-alcohol phosphatidyltransferase family protein [Pelagibius sp.]|uniref:CDP-alcohol phosphatidyltransferase family protein n=1 Tax=Pelagibius sp. TaxID=1931238 RepID=UPI003BB08525
MLDARLRQIIDPPLDRVGKSLSRLGVTANGITVTGFLVGCGAWAMLALESYWWALALILLNRLGDGLDGAVARHGRVTDLGGYLDIVLDFLFYSGVIFFFAVGRPDQALPAAFLIFSFIGTGASFLAFAALAAKLGITTAARGKKSIYYLGGLTEGTETIALFVAICLFPDLFAWFAWIFGGLCWLTTAVRIYSAVETFRN